jgi:ArsR family transcriptional regulator
VIGRSRADFLLLACKSGDRKSKKNRRFVPRIAGSPDHPILFVHPIDRSFDHLKSIWQRICCGTSMLFPLQQLTHLFRALSDGTRLRVVNLLHAQSLCVGDLQQVLGLSQPLVSRHLAVLRAAKLVCTRRQRASVCYSLSRAPFLNYPLGTFLSEMVPFFPELQADAQKLAELKGVGILAQDRPVAPDMHGATNEGTSERLRAKVEEWGKPKERRR